MTDLHWLPAPPATWREQVRGLSNEAEQAWSAAVGLANYNLPFLLTNALDQAVQRALSAPPASLATKPVRLAVLASSTMTPPVAWHPRWRIATRHLDRRA